MGKFNRYDKISYEVRLKLIQLVCEDNMPCAKAAKMLGITVSTARMIVNKFKESGQIFQKKQDRLKRQHFAEFKEQDRCYELGLNECNLPEPITPVLYFIQNGLPFFPVSYPLNTNF